MSNNTASKNHRRTFGLKIWRLLGTTTTRARKGENPKITMTFMYSWNTQNRLCRPAYSCILTLLSVTQFDKNKTDV